MTPDTDRDEREAPRLRRWADTASQKWTMETGRAIHNAQRQLLALGFSNTEEGYALARLLADEHEALDSLLDILETFGWAASEHLGDNSLADIVGARTALAATEQAFAEQPAPAPPSEGQGGEA